MWCSTKGCARRSPLVVQEQTRSVLPRLREEIESVVRHAVYEAVADELAAAKVTWRSR
jgi:hypothetical protein